MSSALEIISHSPAETRRLGVRLGKLAEPGDVFLLIGELGTGKTRLTQGIARGLGFKRSVVSPSFVLVREYPGRLPLYHIDLYRLERLVEVEDLGLDDYLYGIGLSVVEWADRALEAMPPEHLKIELWHVDAHTRRIRLTPSAKRYEDLLNTLRGQVSISIGRA